MSNHADESNSASRGARRRRDAHDEREESEALRWWTKPGVLVFLATLGLAAAGWTLVFQATRKIPVHEATLSGLHMRLVQARWILDQMDHGENFQKPSIMMPDMPDWGKQRVTIELAFTNVTDDHLIFDGSEFYLVPEIGEAVPPIGAQVGIAPVGPGQDLNTAIHFDFDTTLPHGKLRVEWRRKGDSIFLPIPEPAEHYHLRPRATDLALPPKAELLLPIGKPEAGKGLYDQVYGCTACHGDPKVPGSNNVGPHLGSIAELAKTRIPGKSAAQYIYESILDPNAFIAPECKGGLPCLTPSAMPEYANLITLEHAAAILTYLLEQDAPVETPAAGSPAAETLETEAVAPGS